MGLLYADNTGVKTKALLIYEGDQTSMSGRTFKYTKAFLEKIVNATNAWHSRGGRTKLLKDHEFKQDSVGGWFDNFRLEMLDTLNLPHSGMEELLGKWAIFADAHITGDSAIAQYNSGNLKELSLGIDIKNSKGFGSAVIFEVSGVVIPAIEGAQLYSRSEGVIKALDDLGFFAMSDAPNYRAADEGATAMCANCSYAQDGSCQRYDFSYAGESVCDSYQAPDSENPDAFAKENPEALTLESTESDKELYFVYGLNKGVGMANKIEASLREWSEEKGLDLPDEEISLFAKRLTEPKPDPQVEELRQQVAELNRKNELLQKYSKHQLKAKELVDSGKMQPVVYKFLFGDAEIEVYSGHQEKDALELAIELFALQSPIELGKVLPEYDQPKNNDEDSALSEFVNEYRSSNPVPRRVA